MTSIRSRLVACVIGVLVCQAAAMTAAPVALCRGALSADADLHACCKNLKPGQTCPMHHTTHGSPDARGTSWECVCSPSDAVLASIVSVSGDLPTPTRIVDPTAPEALVISFVSSTLEQQRPPLYQPPRA